MAKKKSALQKTSKKVTKKAIKQAKKGKPGLLIFIIIVCLIIGVGAAIVFIPFNGQSIYDKYIRKDNHTSQISTQEFNGVKYDEFQINFLEVGNWNTGDAVFIKAGNNDILIDAGSNYTSVDAIESFIDANCSDKKLEYVIATHAHEDHIAGFSGGSSKNGVLSSNQ